jgi:hypothetical protein
MTWKSDWDYPPPRDGLAGSWDRFIGPGATVAEQLLSLIPALCFGCLVGAYASREQLNWTLFQYAVAVILAFDTVGGISTNATSAAKRWYHRPGRGFAPHFGFAALHVSYIFFVAWLFSPVWFKFFLTHSVFLILSAILILTVRPYLRRSVSLLLLSAGILLSLYVASPPAGMEWFPPFLYTKLLVSHLVREEPYSRKSKGT